MAKNYPEFHDGWFEGCWIDGNIAHIFIAAEGRQRYVLVAGGVALLKVDAARAGNIIFDVLVRTGMEVALEKVGSLCNADDPLGATQAKLLWGRLRTGELTLLEVSPSYGASCAIVANGVELVTRREWIARYSCP